jgi:anthranilate phosphoribosyltransferase
LDELTTTTTSQIWQVSGGEVRHFELDPAKFGLNRPNSEELLGGDAQFNAKVARDLFENTDAAALGAVRDIVALNAAGGKLAYDLAKQPELANANLEDRFAEALDLAFTTLANGGAAKKLHAWVETTQRLVVD